MPTDPKVPTKCACIPCPDCGGASSSWKTDPGATDISDGEEIACNACKGTGYAKECALHSKAATTEKLAEYFARRIRAADDLCIAVGHVEEMIAEFPDDPKYWAEWLEHMSSARAVYERIAALSEEPHAD